MTPASPSAVAPDPGTPPSAGDDEIRTFGPGSMLWDDVGETLNMAFSAPAFMLQAMHPVISDAVDRHSVFRTDTAGRAVRSTDSVMLWVYGGQAAIEEGRRLRVLHRSIRGVNDKGERYSAMDPEAYGWVHGTAFVTSVMTHPLLRGREMTKGEQERLYDEMLQLGEILRVPPRQVPQNVADYWDYYHAMVSDRLERTVVAEELLAMNEHPRIRFPGPLGWVAAWPARRAVSNLLFLLTGAGMTPDARDVLGLRWTAAHQAELEAIMAVVRPIHRRLPEQVRYLPLALHARRHAREVEAIRRRATHEVSV